MVILGRLWRTCLWLLLFFSVMLAMLVTGLRFILPHLNNYQEQIQAQISQRTGIHFTLDEVKGYWKNTIPSIALEGIKFELNDEHHTQFEIGQVEVHVDLLASLWNLEPKVADLTIQNINADFSQWPLFSSSEADDSVTEATTQADDAQTIELVKNLFLQRMDNFSVVNSSVKLRSFDDEVRTVEIERLRWRNEGERHKAEGVIGIADSEFALNKLSVIANFTESGELTKLDGDFYVSAQNVHVSPWISKVLKQSSGIRKASVSLNTWFTLQQGKPVDALLEIQPSLMTWFNDQQFGDSRSVTRHEVKIDHGVLHLVPDGDGLQITGSQFEIETDGKVWSEMSLQLDWHPDFFSANVSQVQIDRLTPLLDLAPAAKEAAGWIKQVKLNGVLSDVRVHVPNEYQDLTYSAQLSQGSMLQWQLLPEVHYLHADISGNSSKAVINASLIDDQLPYGDVFQAPLRIKQGKVNLVWQQDELGWSLWSDKVVVATPDLQAIGEFKLDFPKDESAFLSFYAEADLYNAGETWRYLPTLALGEDLTDYLSTAIQGGHVKTAQLLWYGPLSTFPYPNHDGIFQAEVGLRDAKFSFDTAWPALTDMQLDLLFENDAMYLDSRAAKLMDVNGVHIAGSIPQMAPDGHIEIKALAEGEGIAVRDYMLATPLVDSVGAALSAIQISGPVTASFELNIPFNGNEARAWGEATLDNNPIHIRSPEIELAQASGKVEFNNDVVKAAGLRAELLGQPVSLDFRGENLSQGYGVTIDVLGDWSAETLKQQVSSHWLTSLKGRAPWTLALDLQLNDVGFTYQLDTKVDMQYASLEYPTPLHKVYGRKSTAELQASGNQESISARVSLPNVKYQAEIDIKPEKPVLTATNLVLGKGDFKVSPIVGHQVSIDVERFNLDDWLEIILADDPQVAVASTESQGTELPPLVSSHFPDIPQPENLHMNVGTLTFADLEWHKVKFNGLKKSQNWQMNVNSSEVMGRGSYKNNRDLELTLSKLHVFFPSWEESEADTLIENLPQDAPLISPFDRKFHQNMPNLNLLIDDFWLQGYKVGQVEMDVKREKNRLVWKKLDMKTGTNHLAVNGWWELEGEKSHSDFHAKLDGKNNSDVMARFGISSGVQNASFELASDMAWDGAPWSVKTDTLNGTMSTKLENGVISDVSGAAKLLGMFSLDSIIRKMRLDFTDVFDEGMAFDSITGSGQMQDGIFVTNNIKMDAVSGDMTIRGQADLNTNMVDAEVTFVPDLTSGIPILAAFAVAPQTALAVLAVTTVLSPVVDVFTEVNYKVTGPLDSPTVKEMSRSSSEYKLPEKK